jgi:maleate isomerase
MMTIEYGSKGLIGVLTPQANTTVEPEYWSLMPRGFSLINARLVSSCQTIEERLVDYFLNLDRSIHQFGNAPIRILSIACTGSSYLVGRQKEEAILNRLSKSLGISVVSSGVSVVAALNQLGASKIALCSPYPDSLTKLSIAYWESFGFEVSKVVTVSQAHGQFHPIYGISAQSALDGLVSLSESDAQAIVMLGTGMPTLMPLIKGNELIVNLPVISCMLSTVWYSVSQIDSSFAEISDWIKNPFWLERYNSIQ